MQHGYEIENQIELEKNEIQSYSNTSFSIFKDLHSQDLLEGFEDLSHKF